MIHRFCCSWFTEREMGEMHRGRKRGRENIKKGKGKEEEKDEKNRGKKSEREANKPIFKYAKKCPPPPNK